MAINFTQFVSSTAVDDDDYIVGYTSQPLPGQERRWLWKDMIAPFVEDVIETSPNSGGNDGTFFIMGDGSLRYCGNNANFSGAMGDRADRVVFPRTCAFDPPLRDDEKVKKVYAQAKCV
jgi:hypothetical protein